MWPFALISGARFWPSLIRGPTCLIERSGNSAAFNIEVRGVSRTSFRRPPILRSRRCFLCSFRVGRISLFRGFLGVFRSPLSICGVFALLCVLFFGFFAFYSVFASAVTAFYRRLFRGSPARVLLPCVLFLRFHWKFCTLLVSSSCLARSCEQRRRSRRLF